MTHKELLEKINYEIDLELRGMDAESWHAGARALRAVVELHKPWEGEYFDKAICTACTPDIYVYEYYPCPTIQAIEKELG